MNSSRFTTIKAEVFETGPVSGHALFVSSIRKYLLSMAASIMPQKSRGALSECMKDYSTSKCECVMKHGQLPQHHREDRKLTQLLVAMWRVGFTLAVFLAVSSIWNGILKPSYSNLPQRYANLKNEVEASTKPGRGNINNEKIFIAANIVNEELIRGSWGDNLVSLVDLLGKENVFVSIYENDGGNATFNALQQLRQRLNCNSSVVAGDHVPLSELPTTRLPDGQERVQRLTYLAEIRNRLLRPLDSSYHGNSSNGFHKAHHVRFDKILFLNDVYYSPLEALQLLFSTNADSGRAQYRAACAIDFVQMFKFYDTFVVRDTEGYRVSLQFFPWFTARGTGTSRKDVLSLSDAVRVRSCWGGMAAFDASIFQERPKLEAEDTQLRKNSSLPVKFRSNGELFWEAAECCLIFADLETQYGRSIDGGSDGVYINPYVRTAYSKTTWRWISFWKRFERVFEYYQRIIDFVLPPEWNQRRTHEPGQMVNELVWNDHSNTSGQVRNPHYRHKIINHQTGAFGVQYRTAKPGGFCGERRMFVMKKDVEAANESGSGKNWEKIRVPWHRDLKRS